MRAVGGGLRGARGSPAAAAVRASASARVLPVAAKRRHTNVAGSLASALTSYQDVQDLVIAHGVGSSAATSGVVRPIVVVKVGGEVITKEPETLVESLRVLSSFGLQVRRRRRTRPDLRDGRWCACFATPPFTPSAHFPLVRSRSSSTAAARS